MLGLLQFLLYHCVCLVAYTAKCAVQPVERKASSVGVGVDLLTKQLAPCLLLDNALYILWCMYTCVSAEMPELL